MNIKRLLGHNTLFVLVVVLTALVTWASLAKFINPVTFTMEGSDKIGHFIAYFTLTIAWALFFFFSEKMNKNLKQSLITTSVICILYGVLMEVLQALLTTYRSSDWYDIVANTSGTIFAVLVFVVFKNRILRFKQNKQEVR
ncbi:VanZ family protein [Aquimarina sp. EL_43]|uniref:VanZ family protein n=1 Tax=Aquimarina TaxID=290174 RepID=UPI0004729F3B|nr:MULTISPECIES: VanZ family protein [Aquimarina]MBG6132963.1 VanZ family protein [Aquimarina sp. EL_35]MBG6152274.1 VanZ family protein [Aquimarina sp. EL_32]MBG6171112.1 VanZ family protein [Aquimarina sp. EL_43]